MLVLLEHIALLPPSDYCHLIFTMFYGELHVEKMKVVEMKMLKWMNGPIRRIWNKDIGYEVIVTFVVDKRRGEVEMVKSISVRVRS